MYRYASSGVVGNTVLVSVAVCTDMGVAEWWVALY